MSTPAGWYPDPSDPSRTRWWDGTQWTDHTPPAAPAAPAYAAYPSAPAAVAPAPSAPGADTNTIWIYLSILASTLPVLSIFFFNTGDSLETLISLDRGATIDDRAAAALATQWLASILLITFVSYLLLGLSILFAWLDWRELKKRGVARPFHWGFAFFALIVSIGVYIIGRTVVLKRETGSGLTALWVWIGSIVLAIVITFVWMLVFWQQMIALIPAA